MLLLRASSEELGQRVDLRAALGQGGDAGVPCGELLAAFAEAATRGSDELEALRKELRASLGAAALVEAATIVGIFNGLVRAADATGIPLDAGTLGASVDFRSALGIDAFGGAASTDLGSADPARRSSDVRRLFS